MAERGRVGDQRSEALPGTASRPAARAPGAVGSLGAVSSALLLDLADLVTFGPVGAWAGLAVGLALGWVLAPQLGFGGRRGLTALLSGLYLTTPGTALLPMAGLLTALRSLLAGTPRKAPPPEGRLAERETPIEADYVSRWQDDPDRGSD